MSLDLTFEAPTWDDIYEMLLSLYEKIIKDRFKPDVIVGISRGGLTPARVMCDLLGNANLANITVEFYVGVNKASSEPIITKPISMPVNGKDVLLFDDVADTGKSLCLAKKYLESNGTNCVKTAVIFYKPWSIITPDYYERKTRRWVVFPWERKETLRQLVEIYRKANVPLEEVKEKLADGGMDTCLIDRFLSEIIREECK